MFAKVIATAAIFLFCSGSFIQIAKGVLGDNTLIDIVAVSIVGGFEVLVGIAAIEKVWK